MDFKFFQSNESVTTFNLLDYELPVLRLQPPTFQNDVEFCYQFDDEEPVVFGNGPNDLHIRISPSPNGNIIFNNNGRTFKIFARERR